MEQKKIYWMLIVFVSIGLIAGLIVLILSVDETPQFYSELKVISPDMPETSIHSDSNVEISWTTSYDKIPDHLY